MATHPESRRRARLRIIRSADRRGAVASSHSSDGADDVHDQGGALRRNRLPLGDSYTILCTAPFQPARRALARERVVARTQVHRRQSSRADGGATSTYRTRRCDGARNGGGAPGAEPPSAGPPTLSSRTSTGYPVRTSHTSSTTAFDVVEPRELVGAVVWCEELHDIAKPTAAAVTKIRFTGRYDAARADAVPTRTDCPTRERYGERGAADMCGWAGVVGQWSRMICSCTCWAWVRTTTSAVRPSGAIATAQPVKQEVSYWWTGCGLPGRNARTSDS